MVILTTAKAVSKRSDFAGIFCSNHKTAKCFSLFRTPFTKWRLAELRTRCAVSCRYSPNGEKPRISAKSNIPTLINDTGGIISIAKQHLRKFHH